MTTPEIQSKDLCCGLTPSWKVAGGEGRGQRGGEKNSKGSVLSISYFSFVLELYHNQKRREITTTLFGVHCTPEHL